MKRLTLSALLIFFVISAIGQNNSESDKKKLTSEEIELLREYKELLDDEIISLEDYNDLKQGILDPVMAIVGYCNYSGDEINDWTTVNLGFSENANAMQVANEILEVAGMARSFVIRARSVPNASAVIESDGRRYIDYNPEFFYKIKTGTNTNWAVYSVMAHEIGHHINGHTLKIDNSRHTAELEADFYSGFILYQLGAGIENSLKCMKLISSDFDSPTHPAKSKRIEAIKEGWYDARQKFSDPNNSNKNNNESNNDIEDKEFDPEPRGEISEYLKIRKADYDHVKYDQGIQYIQWYEIINYSDWPIAFEGCLIGGYSNCDASSYKFDEKERNYREGFVSPHEKIFVRFETSVLYNNPPLRCGAVKGNAHFESWWND